MIRPSWPGTRLSPCTSGTTFMVGDALYSATADKLTSALRVQLSASGTRGVRKNSSGSKGMLHVKQSTVQPDVSRPASAVTANAPALHFTGDRHPDFRNCLLQSPVRRLHGVLQCARSKRAKDAKDANISG
jgi:hypothetical protein